MTPRTTDGSDAQLTVLYPMFDLRGRAADRARTWTHEQTLARERYRVVVVSDATAAAQQPEVAGLLGAGAASRAGPTPRLAAVGRGVTRGGGGVHRRCARHSRT